MSQESMWALEAGKGKDIDSPLEPPEGTSHSDTLTLAREIDDGLLTSQTERE